jgi:hypothetical protein
MPLLLRVIAGGLMAGIFEELSLTVFAIPGMRRRYSVPVTGLIVGLIWQYRYFIEIIAFQLTFLYV